MKAGIFLTFALIFLASPVLSQQAFNGPVNSWQYSPPSFHRLYSGDVSKYWPIISKIRDGQCKEDGTDFVVMIPPNGCSPSVVRSDLLQDQNVPVFCQLYSVKTNPLIRASSITSIYFKGKKPKGIVSISYHPARAAVRSFRKISGSPVIENIGYVVLVVRRGLEKDLPEKISGNLTAVIHFDADEAFGAGRSEFYLPVISDEQWLLGEYARSEFFDGKAFLRAVDVSSDHARIAVFKAPDRILREFDLKVGESSPSIYLPGYYCRASFKVRLNKVVADEDSVLIDVDGHETWLRDGSRFLNGQCYVSNIQIEKEADRGNKSEKVSAKISCAGSGSFELVAQKNGDGRNSRNGNDDENFTKMNETIYEILNDFPNTEEDLSGRVFGKEALLEGIRVALKTGRSKEAKSLEKTFIDKYGEDVRLRKLILRSGYDFSNAYRGVYVAGKHHFIGIADWKKGKEEKSADFSVDGGELLNKGEGEKWENSGDKIYLERIFPGGAEFRLVSKGDKGVVGKVEVGGFLRLGSHNIKLLDVSVKPVAYVSVIPKISSARTSAPFTFSIGIEKRAFKLNPNKSLEKAEKVERTIEKWERINKNIGKLVRGFKGACLATSAVLTLKNFFSGFSGKAIARKKVMDYYREICRESSRGNPHEILKCYEQHSSEIERDVEKVAEALKNVNQKMDSVLKKQGMVSSGGLFDKGTVINTKEYVNKLKESLKNESWSVDGVNISKDNLTTVSQVRSVLLYEELIKRQELRRIAEKTLNEGLKSLASFLKNSNNDGGGKNDRNKCSFKKGGEENLEVRYYESGRDKAYPAIVPFEFNGGFWYSYVESSGGSILENVPKGYRASGEVTYFKICSVGKNGLIEHGEGDDICQSFDINTAGSVDQFIGCEGLSPREVKALYRTGLSALREAARQYGSPRVKIFGESFSVGKPFVKIGGLECQDLMSVDECLILFNVCDPVVCPTSRCDMGGRFPVSSVIQSGVIGSIVLCLPNFNEKIYVPVCLSGIHAGIDAYLSVLKGYRDCLKENAKSGRYVGICDEITSVYKCEFFWKQVAPMTRLLIPALFESVSGSRAGVRGGGEYLFAKSAVDAFDESAKFFRDNYAKEMFRAFKLRSIEEAGSTFCRSFIGTSIPTSAKAIDKLLEPDSPTQFYARFSESVLSEATLPATSAYKVYYHIYAGKDKGVNFRIYLQSPPTSGYYVSNPTVMVKTGYVPRGETASETLDFTAPAGYKELCVEIDGQPHCGFEQVTTEFALNELSMELADEAAKNEVTSEKECIYGKPSLSSISPNIQEVVEGAVNPRADLKGIVRVCATKGSVEDSSRWRDVGYCGKENIRCFLDLKSVKEVMKKISSSGYVGTLNKLKEISSDSIQNLQTGISPSVGNTISEVNKLLGKPSVSGQDIDEALRKIVAANDSTNEEKASLLLLKVRVYAKAVLLSFAKKNARIREIGPRPAATNGPQTNQASGGSSASSSTSGSASEKNEKPESGSIIRVSDNGGNEDFYVFENLTFSLKTGERSEFAKQKFEVVKEKNKLDDENKGLTFSKIHNIFK
ncbi:hypothetical protein D6829_02625, partial [Candidatus Pacearchaeota archaeon]